MSSTRDARPHVLALDSGIGGLGIVHKLREAMPDVAVSYVADTGFYPYGRRSDAALTGRLLDLVGGLVEALEPSLVIIACNTASTIALGALRARIATPIVGCVPPVKWASSLSRTRTIGLLATEATVGRDYVRDLQARFAPDCVLLAHGARGLADLAEARFLGEAIDAQAVGAAASALFTQAGGDAIDAVCLGCTHYGRLLPELRQTAPADIAWLDPAEAVARHAAGLLGAPGAQTRAQTRAGTGAPERDTYYVTAPLVGPNASAYAEAVRREGFARLAVLDEPLPSPRRRQEASLDWR